MAVMVQSTLCGLWCGQVSARTPLTENVPGNEKRQILRVCVCHG